MVFAIINCMKKVAIIAAMHGDEVYGMELYRQSIELFPQLKNYVKLIIGNKEAYKRQTRFIDTDMNRHYQVEDDSYESREIERVDQLINVFQPDYIIDIHTTRRDSGVFFISDIANTERQRIYDMLDIDVCVMRNEVIKRSLIGNYPNAVSLEYSLSSISNATTATFVESLNNLVTGKTGDISNKRLYEVSKLITSDEWERYRELKNYELKTEGMALMVPKNISEMDAEYFGFWCKKHYQTNSISRADVLL